MRTYTISTGTSRMASTWTEKKMSWDDLLNRIKTPERGLESHAEFFKLPKTKQDELKDVGGFVGGSLAGGKRSAQTVTGRDLITLDLDAIPANETADIVEKVKSLGFSFLIYSTRKHTARKPRLRVLIPLDRTVTADEYEPVARMVAQMIGIGFCDPTTFQPSRLMYWPSASADAEYVFEHGEAAECCADWILCMYADWRDVATWPIVPGEQNKISVLHKKQEDPTTKEGMVGAFCRTFDIYNAIARFLPGIYTGDGDRLTYAEGSTTGGAIVYGDGLFLYSHHATDPCSGQLVNAFDLVRLHKFGEMDAKKSFSAMVALCNSDEEVLATLAKERQEKVQEAFKPLAQTEGLTDEYLELDEKRRWLLSNQDPNWPEKELVRNKESGVIQNTVDNLVTIIRRDEEVGGRVWYNEFSERLMVLTPVPWEEHPTQSCRQWTDVDDTGLYGFIERKYIHKATIQKTVSALNLAASKTTYDPVVCYLSTRKWDGVPRAESILIDYLGASDTPYTRVVTRKMLLAAVTRAFIPGAKFDNMLILVGKQGVGKSTLFRKLGGNWFSDSLTSFDGKDASEMLQGVWIVEVGELNAMTRQESNSVKQFLSKQDDQYRAAYARRKETHPRRCIFVGTTNDEEFLKDTTGNRRFWPVRVCTNDYDMSVFDDLDLDTVGQIWAEVVTWFHRKEELYLPREIEKMAEEVQKEHMITTGREGVVEEFLERQIPENWYDMTELQRKQFMNGNLALEVPLVDRVRVCPMEIWMLCYEKSKGTMQRQDVTEINRILKTLGWKPTAGPYKFGDYGKVRGFTRDA